MTPALAAHCGDPVAQPLDPAGRAEHHPLVVELGGDQLPALVLLADQHVDRHPHVVEVRRVDVVGAVGGDDRGPGVAGVRGVDDQDRDALVLRRIGIGAHRQPEVVGLVAAGGPHLLAVDDVVVAVLAGGGAQRGQVGAGVGLGVADREVHVAGQDPLEEQVLLLLGAVADQGRADGLQGHRRQVYVGPLGLVGEDRLLDLAEPVAAVLLRPADAHPAVGAHLAHDLLVGLAVPVARPVRPGVALRRPAGRGCRRSTRAAAPSGPAGPG